MGKKVFSRFCLLRSLGMGQQEEVLMRFLFDEDSSASDDERLERYSMEPVGPREGETTKTTDALQAFERWCERCAKASFEAVLGAWLDQRRRLNLCVDPTEGSGETVSTAFRQQLRDCFERSRQGRNRRVVRGRSAKDLAAARGKKSSSKKK